MLARVHIQLLVNGGMWWSSWGFPRLCLTPKGHCPGGRAVKGDADFLLNCPVYLDRWKLVLAYRQGCRQGNLRAFLWFFNCWCYWNGILWGRDCVSRGGWWSFLLSPFGSPVTMVVCIPYLPWHFTQLRFESCHSHLFLCSWLSHHSQKNPFALTLTVTPWESEVQLNGLTRSAGGFRKTGFCFETSPTCPWPQRDAAVFPLLFFLCFSLGCFFLFCSDIRGRVFY